LSSLTQVSVNFFSVSLLISVTKIVADAGYRGHNASKEKAFKVYVAGQKRGLSDTVCSRHPDSTSAQNALRNGYD
jgi:hypothetical protein